MQPTHATIESVAALTEEEEQLERQYQQRQRAIDLFKALLAGDADAADIDDQQLVEVAQALQVSSTSSLLDRTTDDHQHQQHLQHDQHLQQHSPAISQTSSSYSPSAENRLQPSNHPSRRGSSSAQTSSSRRRSSMGNASTSTVPMEKARYQLLYGDLPPDSDQTRWENSLRR